MNRDEILEMIVKHIISSRIEEGTYLAITYSRCYKL